VTEVTIRFPGLDWKAPIVDGSGRPTPYFQRFWQLANFKVQVAGIDLTSKADAGTSSGWTAMTGTASKGGFDTGTVTLGQLAQVVKAMVDAGLSSRMIIP
jgi:hypothetical protein